MSTIDTANHFMVVANGGSLAILNPPKRPVTPREALNLAAWLVSMAHAVEPDLSEQEFQRTLAAIQNA